MRSEQETNRAIILYSDMIRRICLYHLKNSADTEDVFQNVYLKYLLSNVDFTDVEHEKAWFIRVSINACKDHLKSLFRRGTVSLDTLAETASELESDHTEVLEAVLSLPARYKDAVYLHYYEGYSASEIANILKTGENTVYSWLSRGRTLLKKKLGGDGLEE